MSTSPFGRRVAVARRERGWTQEQLADAAGVSARTVQHVESGDATKRPHPSTRRALGEALGWQAEVVDTVQVTVKTPDGSSARFTGAPRDVAVAAHRFLTLLDPDPDDR